MSLSPEMRLLFTLYTCRTKAYSFVGICYTASRSISMDIMFSRACSRGGLREYMSGPASSDHFTCGSTTARCVVRKVDLSV
jgi:hypothetical protein